MGVLGKVVVMEQSPGMCIHCDVGGVVWMEG